MTTVNRAEDNAQWIADKIREHGLTEEIAALALTRYLARYATQYTINTLFNDIVRRTGG